MEHALSLLWPLPQEQKDLWDIHPEFSNHQKAEPLSTRPGPGGNVDMSNPVLATPSEWLSARGEGTRVGDRKLEQVTAV